MRLVGWGIGFTTVLILLAVSFPVIAPYVDGGKRTAYRRVLSFHTAGNAPQWHRQTPFLYVSWFPKGDPRHADESLIYPNKMVMGRRVLWNYAIQGGGGEARNMAAFQSLCHVPTLPKGLTSPDDVAYGDLLIVSQLVSGQWTTRYYYRKHLPIQVQQVQGLLTAVAS